MSKKTLAQEYIPSDEASTIQDLANRLKEKVIQDNPTGIMRRDAHPKMHGVVKAEFTVEANLPAELRVGVFAVPKIFQAWIRFSNAAGTRGPDANKDFRGMAIKLMGVDGAKILEDELDETTQDFLLINANMFLTRDAREFDLFVKAMTGSLWAKACFFLPRPSLIWKLLTLMSPCANPLQVRYWSTTPFLFGNAAVKYSAIPHVAVADTVPVNPDADFLRQAMVRQLGLGAAVFDFAVQLQTDADAMPIEDASVAWSEDASPFRKVATIRILQQEFDGEAQRVFGENLSFTPWHSLAVHRPLGGINRARKVVYRTISMFRHARNGVARKEPTSWDIS